MKSLSKKNILVFLGILLAFTISYWPALFINYAHHDDYRFWENPPGSWALHPFHLENIIYGRFISSYLLTFTGWCINSVADLNILRFINIIQLSVCALILTRILEQYFKNNTLQASLTTILFFTLPPFQVIISYASYFFIPLTMLLALAAAWLANQISTTNNLKDFIINPRAALAILCLFCALATYASTAMFYWTAVACFLLSSDAKTFKEKLLSAGKFFYVGFASLALYALFLQGTKEMYSPYVFQMYDPYQITTNYLSKLQWFIAEPVYNSLNLWNIFPDIKTAIPVAILILSGFLLSRSLTTFVLAAVLLVLSFLPSLLAKENVAFYRCCTALTPLIMIGMIWAAKKWLNGYSNNFKEIFLTAVLLIGSCYGIFQAQKTVLNFVAMPAHLELNEVKDVLKQVPPGRSQKISLARPDLSSRKYRFDEFGRPSLSFPQDLRGILACAARENSRSKSPDTSRILRKE